MLKSFSSIVAGTTIFILHFNGAHAFWRLLCDGSVGLARIDPLTNFGTASEHVHSIKGGSGKSFFLSRDVLPIETSFIRQDEFVVLTIISI